MTILKNKKLVNLLIAILIVAIVIVFFAVQGDTESFTDKYEGFDLSTGDIGRSNTYSKYLERHSDAASPGKSIDISVDKYDVAASHGVEVKDDEIGGSKVTAVYTDEDSTLEYKVNVPEAGFYNILIEYYPLTENSRGIDIERTFYLNGEVPFLGSDALTFRRVWGDASREIKKDNQGNQIRPTQIQFPSWQTVYFNDYTGYVTEPYKYYFEKGNNTLTLEGVSDPMAIKTLSLVPVVIYPPYSEYISNIDTSSYASGGNYLATYQGEDAIRRSSPSLYATYDRSSGDTVPTSVMHTVLNMTGGTSWSVAGQWIEWDFEVPEDGMYAISIKARQNYNRGLVSTRSVYIDNEILCSESAAVEFKFSNEWELLTLKDADGNDMYFPLKAGSHTIKIEVTNGELSSILTALEDSIFRLNDIYLKVLVLTGAEPDTYRDYQIEVIYPEIINEMRLESRILYKIVDDLVAFTGEKGSQAAAVQTIAKQLEKFADKPANIPKALRNYKDNISAVGTSLTGLTSSPLDIDFLTVSQSGAKLPKAGANFFVATKHEIVSFVASFFIDYNNLGDVHAARGTTEVWMLSGRDQSTVLKTMIDDTYTPLSGKGVNVKLVGPEALMPAVVAGTGPDVALTVGNSDPINYAYRGAALDLTKFDDFGGVTDEFFESAIVPFRYEGGVYGLPETQYYNVMFYRKDILEDMGLEPPDTWQELINIIPILQKNNMQVGIPSVDRKINNITNPDLSNFLAQLYQNGGALYSENGARSLLDNEKSIIAFEHYTKYFTHYKCPLIYDFVNRFRTGEMPIGFVDFNNYNTLQVSAPEIRGLWGFAVLPGTLQEDGTMNRATSSWGQAAMILSNTKNEKVSWEFLKWWISADTQVRFGRELEALMGAAARYATANKAAFGQLAWSTADAKVLMEQWEQVVGTPEVPGGYYASRNIVNAARRVINNQEDTRETLLDYNRMIQEELTKKRKEFGLEIIK